VGIIVRYLTNLTSRQVPVYPVEQHPPADQLLGLLLRLVHQHWALAVDSALRDAGFGDIRAPHASVFPFVPADGISVSELAKRAHVRKQTMAQAVEELEQMGYVERRPDPRDRRARLVLLTPRGKAVPPVAIAAGRQVEARWSELIGEPKLESLRRSLQGLLTELQSDAAVPSPERKS
jgi:DNA-binding MarR family transcriptional regulator